MFSDDGDHGRIPAAAYARGHEQPILRGLLASILGLANFAEGDLMGDFDGPFRFAKVRPLLTSPLKLGRTIRAFGADFLALDRATAAILPKTDDLRRHFRQVYSDDAWTVWRLEGF